MTLSAFEGGARIRNRALSVLFAGMAALPAMGCGAATEGDGEGEVTSQDQALGEASCATATPDSTRTGYIDINNKVISGIHYSNPNCYLAWITDISNFSLQNSITTVTIHDPPSGAADCNSRVIYSQLYVKQGASWVAQGPKLSSVGQWVNGGGLAFCNYPAINYQSGSDLVLGKSYRIAASGRFVNSSSTIALDEFTQKSAH